MAGNPNPTLRNIERRYEKLEDDVRRLKLRGGPEDGIALADLMKSGWYDAEVGGVPATMYRQGGRVWLVGVIGFSDTGSDDPQKPFDLWDDGWKPSRLQNAFFPVDPDNSDHLASPGWVGEFLSVGDAGLVFDQNPTYVPPGDMGYFGYPPDGTVLILDGVSYLHE